MRDNLPLLITVVPPATYFLAWGFIGFFGTKHAPPLFCWLCDAWNRLFGVGDRSDFWFVNTFMLIWIVLPLIALTYLGYQLSLLVS